MQCGISVEQTLRLVACPIAVPTVFEQPSTPLRFIDPSLIRIAVAANPSSVGWSPLAKSIGYEALRNINDLGREAPARA
jgi:hypothetical protein